LINQERIRKASGFTLIEVLLVLALVGLMAGLVAGNAGAFISGGNFEPPHRVLKKSVLDAVYYAGERKRATYLYYDEQNATFLVEDSSGSVLSRHLIFKKPTSSEDVADEGWPKVNFFAVGPLAGINGGRTQYTESQTELKRVTFHSGSSIPFEARLEHHQESKKLFFDPFSGYALKEDEE